MHSRATGTQTRASEAQREADSLRAALKTLTKDLEELQDGARAARERGHRQRAAGAREVRPGRLARVQGTTSGTRTIALARNLAGQVATIDV